jgi:hypothetical protein
MCLEGYWWEQRGNLGEDGEDVFIVGPLLLGDAGLAELDDDSVKVALNDDKKGKGAPESR